LARAWRAKRIPAQTAVISEYKACCWVRRQLKQLELILKLRQTIFQQLECLFGFGGMVALIAQFANLATLFGNDAATI
jgi:hypothetical protein